MYRIVSYNELFKILFSQSTFLVLCMCMGVYTCPCVRAHTRTHILYLLVMRLYRNICVMWKFFRQSYTDYSQGTMYTPVPGSYFQTQTTDGTQVVS